MEKERCETCKCFKQNDEYGGYCRRFPPKQLIDPYPKVPKSSWCGGYIPK